MSDLPTALYEPDDGRYVPTALTRGPWNPLHQHAGPPAALLAREIDRAGAIPGGQLVRLTFDILAPVELVPVVVSAGALRPGRRVELLEGLLARADDDTPLIRATAWRMRSDPGVAPPSPPDPPPGPPGSGGAARLGFWRDEVAYHRALDWRLAAGNFDEPGPATAWARLRVPLIAGEQPAPLERLLAMADAASGVSAALDWDSWLFVNVDLGIHLERPPAGEWMAMAARTRIGPFGTGQCGAVLYDADGRVGRSTQSLLVAPR